MTTNEIPMSIKIVFSFIAGTLIGCILLVFLYGIGAVLNLINDNVSSPIFTWLSQITHIEFDSYILTCSLLLITITTIIIYKELKAIEKMKIEPEDKE